MKVNDRGMVEFESRSELDLLWSVLQDWLDEHDEDTEGTRIIRQLVKQLEALGYRF